MINLLDIVMRNAITMVFDDSLSPTELLSAVVAKVNEMATALNVYLGTDITTVIQARLDLWETDGTMADLVSGVIVSEVTDARSSAIKNTVFASLDARLEAGESEMKSLSVDVTQFGAVGDGVTDDTAAIQSAIDYCILNHCDLSVSKLCKVTASLMIDRAVDDTDFDAFFTIYSKTGGGFYVATPINIFSSNFAFVGVPIVQTVRWKDLRFVASVNTLGAYVLDDCRFLRSVFEGCTFSKIKCLLSLTYTQSIYFYHCNVRRVSGTFFKSPMNYDLQVIGGLYESITGDCFDIKQPVGCKINTMIEGVSGTALLINGAQGIDICVYMEANGLDIDSRTGGLVSRGINIHGSYFAHGQNATYSIVWGACEGCISTGNWHTNNMHDTQDDSVVEINDIAQTNIVNSGAGYHIRHGGYREVPASVLSLRTDVGDAYAVTNLISKATIIGRRVQMDIKCTLTSTGTNDAGMLYIPSLFPIDTDDVGMLCGTTHVAGSSLPNAGISPLAITSVSPLRIQSLQQVVPANTVGNSWTVTAQISYIATAVPMP